MVWGEWAILCLAAFFKISDVYLVLTFLQGKYKVKTNNHKTVSFDTAHALDVVSCLSPEVKLLSVIRIKHCFWLCDKMNCS